MKKIRTLLAGLAGAIGCAQASAVFIDFDDPGLSHLDDISSFYTGLGVEFFAIANPFPIGPGPFPAPATLPATLGAVRIWNPGPTAPGESPPNFAVGDAGTTQPGDEGILMSFASAISSLSVIGLDFGNNPSGNDGEEMTLTSYDAAGNRIGQSHFTTEFVSGAIAGSVNVPGTRYVAFNYTNTTPGFYGIDDLEFTFAPTTPRRVPDAGATALLLGLGIASLAGLRRKLAS